MTRFVEAKNGHPVSTDNGCWLCGGQEFEYGQSDPTKCPRCEHADDLDVLRDVLAELLDFEWLDSSHRSTNLLGIVGPLRDMVDK